MMISGVPVLSAFLLTVIFMIWAGGYDPAFLLPYGFSRINTIILLALPLFILAGSLMEQGGIAERLVSKGNNLFGRIKGGLAILSIIVCGLFGAISGSAMACVSCIGSIMGPRMIKAGYPQGLTASLLASAGVLGLLIPPSMLMILYAWLSNASVLKCFLATVIPGFMLIFGLCVSSLIMLRSCKTIEVVQKIKNRIKLPQRDENGRRIWGAGPAFIMPVIILGGIYGGFFTTTEAAAISCIYAIPVGFFIYRGLTLKNFGKTIHNAGVTTGVVMVCGLGTTVLGRIFINENLHLQALDLLNNISTNPTVILFFINIFIIILGMLMDDDCVTLLVIPITAPMVTAMGVDLIHYAAIIGVNIGMANITPPTAPVLYLASRVTNVPVKDMLPPLYIYLFLVYLPVLILVTIFPQLGTWLPALVIGQ
jgi:tripartite ATP-independent transporter DctM subunit